MVVFHLRALKLLIKCVYVVCDLFEPFINFISFELEIIFIFHFRLTLNGYFFKRFVIVGHFYLDVIYSALNIFV